MGKFTMTLQEISNFYSEFGEDGRKKLISLTLADYDIFDENYRDHLNNKIMDHFWLREIGLETIEMWAFYFKRSMNEQMPFFNQLYKSQLIEYDPLHNFNWTDSLKSETHAEDDLSSNTGGNANSKVKSAAKVINMAMPNTGLSRNGNYATAGTDTFSETENRSDTESATSATNKANSTNSTTRTMQGTSGNPATMILEFRRAMLNIDLMLFDELEPNFMSIWSKGDRPGKSRYYV